MRRSLELCERGQTFHNVIVRVGHGPKVVERGRNNEANSVDFSLSLVYWLHRADFGRVAGDGSGEDSRRDRRFGRE